MIGRAPLGAALLVAGAAVVLGPGPAGGAETGGIEAEIESLDKRLDRLEASLTGPVERAVAAGVESGWWRIPGTDSWISVGGYVKGDFHFDSGRDLGDFFVPGRIGLDGQTVPGDEDGAVGMHARETRLRVVTHTPSALGALGAVIETDFYGGGDALRLRHAAARLGPVLAGQAWSLLVDGDMAADTVDLAGPVGTYVHREPQLRLSLDMAPGLVGQAAVEPGLEGNELPSLLAALRYRSGWGGVSASGAIGRVDRDGETEGAHAIALGAFFDVTDATRLTATFGRTSGIRLIWGGGPGAVMARGDLKVQESTGGTAGVSHRWSDTVRSGAYFGWVENDTAEGAPARLSAGRNKALRTLHVNVFWSPVPRADIGFEIMHGWRETYPRPGRGRPAPTEGEATRAQLGVKYSF